jgi:hypothetical protein
MGNESDFFNELHHGCRDVAAGCNTQRRLIHGNDKENGWQASHDEDREHAFSGK